MFLHQKFGYTLINLTDDQIEQVKATFIAENPQIVGFDTETTGLNVLKDKPFLLSFGFNKHVYVAEPTEKMLELLMWLGAHAKRMFAHNVQYDYHMLLNTAVTIPNEIKFADSMTVARLTEFADKKMRLSLETLGLEYVDDQAKIGGHAIRLRLSELNRANKLLLKEKFIEHFGKDVSFSKIFDAYRSRVQYLKSEFDDYFDFINLNYKDANYLDVYKMHPSLMINYAADDVVIMLEYLKKALPTLMHTDPELKTFNRECALIKPICEMERIGFKADINYLLESRMRMNDYRTLLYSKLHTLLGATITVGQHKEIAKLFEQMFGILMYKTDEAAFEEILSLPNAKQEAKDTALIIIELRTLDKWISTYIDGKLNSIVDGRLYTSINNSGAVSGRVSSNMQQQPKEGFIDKDGNELFHPRKVFLADEDHYLFFLDFSQMELRLQAYYTMLVGNGDKNMCRAYIPFECKSNKTGELFNPKDKTTLSRWNSGEWVDETNKVWNPIDLHAVTTFIAFPELENNEKHPDFKKLRKLGKMCNFLKNYQGGEQAIIEQMKVDETIAKNLDQAYYKAFPEVKSYQQWVTKELTLHGYVENLYGRRYYMQDPRWFYKGSNYLIQGGCADLVKSKEIEVTEFLKNYKTKFVLPIHDELVFSVPKDEVYLVYILRGLLQDVHDIMPWVPMISEIEYTETNWADKKPFEEEYEF